MPKAFSEQEKEAIRAQMREKGRKLFERQGIRKTSVDELAQAAGISKGAFYLFYPSKEELLMEILEGLESDFRAQIFDFSFHPRRNTQELLAKLFKDTMLTWDKYPLLKNFSRAEYDYLARKLPLGRIQAHAARDDEFVEELIKRIKKEGISVKASPRAVSSLMKSLFFVGLHREDFGTEAYEEAMGVLSNLVARYIVEGE
jgi:AcrR family transcriptional regulator